MWDEESTSEPSTLEGLDPAALERLEELRVILDDVSERLGDVSIDIVRQAIESGSGRPAGDKIIARARRSVDKAARLLAGLG